MCGSAFVPATLLLRPENIIAGPVSYDVKKSITEPIMHQSAFLSLTNRKTNYAPL
jgi:hypothetical protein